jgi:hypothetical protein
MDGKKDKSRILTAYDDVEGLLLGFRVGKDVPQSVRRKQ